MKIQQLSVFLENKPGQILEPCRLLAEANVNLRTLSVADTQQFGILRMIVSDSDKALELLGRAGYVVKTTEVLAIEVPDRPGGLTEVMGIFENSGINIEYMYSFRFGRSDKAALIFRFDDPDAAIKLLESAGVDVLDSVEAYQGQ